MEAGNERAMYVYGVVRANGPPSEAKGIDDQPLRVVAREGVAALTSEVPDRELEAGRDELMTHSRVLESALERGVVLPMRFGIVMPSEASVRERLLDAHREVLERQLDEMDGKVEINIKGIYEEGTILHELLAEDPEIARLRGEIEGKPEEATYFERIRLGELVAGGLEAKRSQDQQAVVEHLVPLAVAHELGAQVHERMAVNASFLVARDKLARFDQEIDKLGGEQAGRVRFRYTGPLPPHSFVELSLEAV